MANIKCIFRTKATILYKKYIRKQKCRYKKLVRTRRFWNHLYQVCYPPHPQKKKSKKSGMNGTTGATAFRLGELYSDENKSVRMRKLFFESYTRSLESVMSCVTFSENCTDYGSRSVFPYYSLTTPISKACSIHGDVLGSSVGWVMGTRNHYPVQEWQ